MPSQKSATLAPQQSFVPRQSHSSSGQGPQGGSGVEKRHLRNHKAWRADRDRHGLTWMQRKMRSTTYCSGTLKRSA